MADQEATGPREGHRPPGSRAIPARPVLRRLVSRGVDYTSPDPDGHTPAWYAQLNWPILEYLFSPEATADPGARTAVRELRTLVGRGDRAAVERVAAEQPATVHGLRRLEPKMITSVVAAGRPELVELLAGQG